jgi:hypothetical protein
VVLIPLAAIVWHEAGRHPLAGVAVAYAGISGAFAGNLLPGQFDALLLGITQGAAQMLEPQRVLNPLGNWWFTAALGLLLLAVAWPVAERVVEPRLRALRPDGDALAALPRRRAGRRRRGAAPCDAQRRYAAGGPAARLAPGGPRGGRRRGRVRRPASLARLCAVARRAGREGPRATRRSTAR